MEKRARESLLTRERTAFTVHCVEKYVDALVSGQMDNVFVTAIHTQFPPERDQDFLWSFFTKMSKSCEEANDMTYQFDDASMAACMQVLICDDYCRRSLVENSTCANLRDGEVCGQS
jgi:hypothetical protein